MDLTLHFIEKTVFGQNLSFFFKIFIFMFLVKRSLLAKIFTECLK